MDAALGLSVAGILGIIIAACRFLSPIPTFVKIYRVKSTEEYSAVPYVVTLTNCLLWLFYGTPFVNMELLVMIINGAGTAIELVYLFVYLYYSKDGRTRGRAVFMLLGALLVYSVVVLVTMLEFHVHHERQLFVGALCVIVGTSMHVSPLTIMKTVITSKSTAYMPLPLSVCNLVNSVFWTVYGVLASDLFIIIPNAAGVFFAACQLALYAIYCGNEKRVHQDIGRKGSILAETNGTAVSTAELNKVPSSNHV